MDDERNVDSAFVGVLLVPFERCVPRLGPTPGIVGVTVGSANIVEMTDRLVGCLDHEVEELPLVQDTERPALLTRAVVGEQEDQGVVELAEASQRVDQASDLGVGVVEEAGEGLLEARGENAVALGEVRPGLYAWVPRSQQRALGE